MKDALLIIFAKAPVPGQVKTRLLTKYTGAEAAQIYQSMLTFLVSTHSAADSYDLALYCSPGSEHTYFQGLQRQCRLSLSVQRGQDLGERMYQALAEGLVQYKKVILIGSDAPVIDRAYIQRVLHLLDTKPVVFGPAEDGGYVLVAVTEVQQDWFELIDWSTSAVMQQTLQKIPAVKVALTETLWDVDEPADLIRLKSSDLWSKIKIYN